MSNYIIDKVDFHELECQKYWQPPASWSDEKRKTEVRNRIFSGDWYGSRKMDGAFYMFIKSMDGEMELIGRSKGVGGDYLDKIDWVPQCHHFFNRMPNGTCLIGELVFPNNEGSKNTTTIMGCLVDKAKARQEKGDKLHYYVFDVLAFDGLNMVNEPAETRFKMIGGMLEQYGDEEFIDFAVYYTGEQLWEELQEILASGGEGIVMTKGDAKYEPGKRPSKTCMKVKQELKQTIDCVVIGANAPTKEYTGKEIDTWQYWINITSGEKLQGEYYKDYSTGAQIMPVTKPYFKNWAGSLKIGLYKDGELVHFGDLSGITDEVKENWRDYVGRVVEVGGMQLFADTGAIRHPKLITWRAAEDKAATDCTWDQLNM